MGMPLGGSGLPSAGDLDALLDGGPCGEANQDRYLAAVVAGAGYAAIPSASGVISACKISDGSLKLIDKETGPRSPAQRLGG